LRIKILEGLALAKPIVSTEVGAEGISAVSGRDMMIVKDPAGFAEKVLSLVENEKEYQAMSNSARKYIESEFNNQTIVGGLVKAYEKLLDKI